MDSLGPVDYSCDQQRLRLDRVGAQSDLEFSLVLMSEAQFCLDAAHIYMVPKEVE